MAVTWRPVRYDQLQSVNRHRVATRSSVGHIPSGVFIVPKALIYTGNWRLPEYWLWRSVVEGSYLLSVIFGTLLIVTVLLSAFDALVKSRQRWRDPRAHLMKALLHALREVVALKEGASWPNPEALAPVLGRGPIRVAALDSIGEKISRPLIT